jgi:hypothetical protein
MDGIFDKFIFKFKNADRQISAIKTLFSKMLLDLPCKSISSRRIGLIEIVKVYFLFRN